MTVLQQIDSALAALGLNPAARAGAEGNLQVESGFNPGAYNAGEGAIGLAQWEGGRRTALDAYAAAHGLAPTDIRAQLGYMGTELTAGGLIPKLNAAGSPAAAATLWDTQYERSAGTTRAQRIADAQAIASGMPPGPAPSTTASSTTGAPVQNAGLLSSGLSDIWGTFKPIAYTGIFAVAGLALVVIGATVTATPKIKSAASQAAPIAAMAAV